MTDDRLKIIFGFVMMISLVTLAGVIALGKVEEHTSYGLPYVLGSLSVLAGGFGQWAFGGKKGRKATAKDKE